MENIQNKFRQIDLFHLTSYLGLEFLNFSGSLYGEQIIENSHFSSSLYRMIQSLQQVRGPNLKILSQNMKKMGRNLKLSPNRI